MSCSSSSLEDQLVPNPKAKSKVWENFGFAADENGTVLDKKKVVCRLCRQSIGYLGNTTNLTYHIQRVHPTIYKQQAEQKEVAAEPGAKVQQTIHGSISKTAAFPRDSIKHAQLVKATADFICHSLQPIRVVDEESFRQLLQIAEPRFQLPHRTHFAEKVIPQRYCEIRSAVEKELESVEKCTFTTDLWTAQHQNRGYISLTVHYVNEYFKLQSKCLQTQEVTTDHTSISIEAVLSSMLSSWNIRDKVCGATTDNASNMVNAIRMLAGVQHFPCVAHTLQLSVKSGLNVSRVQRVLGRCRKLVEHFNKSSKQTYKLREKQEMLQLPKHRLIQECITRWGSTLHMIERLMEQQAAIAAVLMEGNMRHLIPESSEWTLIEQLVDILLPFEQATEAMSGVKYPTVSTVKPLLYKLLHKTLLITETDSGVIKEVKIAINRDLKERFQSSEVQKIINVATYLDPRYKELPFVDEVTKVSILSKVEDELLAMEVMGPQSASIDERRGQLDDDDLPPPKKKKGPISTLLGDIFENQGQLSFSEVVSKEMAVYKAEKPAELDSDPLQWWYTRKSQYPLMSRVVQKYFSFVATSVPSERLFSSAGNVITDKRSCLTPEHANHLIFLYENQ